MQLYRCFFRNGKLIGREHFYLTTVPGDTGKDILTSFIKQYYIGNAFYSKEFFGAGRSGGAGNFCHSSLAEIRIIQLEL